MTHDRQPPEGRSKIIVALLIVVLLLAAVDAVLFYGLVRQQAGAINTNANNQSSSGNVVTTDDPYAGSADAKVVIVEFGDFQCPFCFQEFPTVREIIDSYGDNIKFIYRDFPLTDIHPHAQQAAEAGECAHEQGKFWEMHDKMFINQSDLSVTALKRYAGEIGLETATFNRCLDTGKYKTEVQEDFNDGLRAGVPGTPTFFINGRMFARIMSTDEFRTIIDQLLAIYNQ